MWFFSNLYLLCTIALQTWVNQGNQFGIQIPTVFVKFCIIIKTKQGAKFILFWYQISTEYQIIFDSKRLIQLFTQVCCTVNLIASGGFILLQRCFDVQARLNDKPFSLSVTKRPTLTWPVTWTAARAAMVIRTWTWTGPMSCCTAIFIGFSCLTSPTSLSASASIWWLLSL